MKLENWHPIENPIVKMRVTIADLIDIIHFSIIDKFGKNDICLEHTKAIHALTQKNGVLNDLDVTNNELFKSIFMENFIKEIEN